MNKKLLSALVFAICISIIGNNGSLKASEPANVDGNKITFTTAAYYKMFNDLAQKYVDEYLSSAGDRGFGLPKERYNLSKGKHTLTVYGREEGSVLEELWLGSENSTPGKGEGINIAIGGGKITPPMKLNNNRTALISGLNQGSSTYEFTLEKDGVYSLWGKGYGPDAQSNSFFVQIDAGEKFIWGVPVDLKSKAHWVICKPRGPDYYANFCFIFTWAVTNPKGKFYNNKEIRDFAYYITLVDVKTMSKRKVSPNPLWYLSTLEAVRMWQKDPRSTNEQISNLLNAMKSQLEKTYELTTKGNGWIDNTPNIQLQCAAILRLGAAIWEHVDKVTSEKWLKTSEQCIDRAFKYKIKDGPFVYSYGSGVDSGYYGEDLKNLSCLYNLTKNDKFKKILIDMAKMAENTTKSGIIVSSASPWWKHNYDKFNKDRHFILSAYPALLSGDGKYATALAKSIKTHITDGYPRKIDWLFPYYNMLLDDFTVKAEDIKNGSFDSFIENGPVLRTDTLYTAMPWRSWCESTCGTLYSDDSNVISQVCSIILTAITDDQNGKIEKAYYPVGYSIVEKVNPTPEIRKFIRTNDLVASAVVFRPAVGGPATPQHVGIENKSPWLRTDIYLADESGFAGVLELSALEDNSSRKMNLWVRVSDNAKAKDNKIQMEGLEVILENQFSGQLHNKGKIWGYPGGMYPLYLYEADINNVKTGGDKFLKGDHYRTSVAVNGKGKEGLRVVKYSVENGIYDIALENKSSGKKYQLLFNSAKTNCEVKKLPGYEIYQSAADNYNGKSSREKLASDNNNQMLKLPAESLTLLISK